MFVEDEVTVGPLVILHSFALVGNSLASVTVTP